MNLRAEVRDGVIRFKGRLDPDIAFEAKCLRIKQDGDTLVADPRFVHPSATKAFLEWACPSLMKSPVNEIERKRLLENVRKLYLKTFEDFKAKYADRFPKWKGELDLMKHQFMDGMYVLNLPSCYLGWEMGVGKSAAAFLPAILEPEKYQRVLIITPANVKRGWLRDMVDEWGSDIAEWTMYDSKANQCIVSYFDERFVLVNYNILGKYMNDKLTEKPFDMIICDEAHMVKNDKTQNYKNVYKIVEANPSAKLVLVSGTPASNRMDDLFAPLKLSRHPLGDDRKAFEQRYLLRGARNKVIGALNQEELHRRLSGWMFRRTQADTIGLPKVSFSRVFFPLGEYKEEYDKIIAQITEERADFEKFVYENKETIQQWVSLNEAYDKARRDHGDSMQSRAIATERNKFRSDNWDIIDRYVKDDGLKSTTHIMSLNAITAMAKVPGVIEDIEDILQAQRENNTGDHPPKVVLFGGFTKPLEMIKEHFGDRAVLVTGSVDSHDRDYFKRQFMESESVEVFIGNMQAAGVGINGLQHVCNDVVFINMPMVPKDFEQALARVNRKGQKRPVRCRIMLCEDSIDEMLYDLVSSKADDIHKVIDRNSKIVIDYNAIEKKLIKQ